MVEGSGSIPLTSGSGSWRLKNMWIRIRIRITGCMEDTESLSRIPDQDLVRIRIGLAPPIRISICIMIKSWIQIRICLETYADPQHCLSTKKCNSHKYWPGTGFRKNLYRIPTRSKKHPLGSNTVYLSFIYLGSSVCHSVILS
jgi:hypothetical protein